MNLSHQYTSEDILSGKGDFVGSKIFFKFYVILLVLLTTSSFYNLFSDNTLVKGGQTAGAAGNKIYLLLWIGLYGMTGLVFLMTVLKKGISKGFLWALPVVLWVILSFSWSVSSNTTLYFGVMFIMQVVMAYVVVENVAPERFFRILIVLMSVLLVLSLVGFIVMPEKTSSLRYGGGWLVNTEMNGVFSHKSDAGYFFALLIILVIGARDIGLRWPFFVRFMIITLAVIGIILANSATALASALLLSALYLVMPLLSHSKTLLYFFALFLLMFALLVPYLDIGQFAEMIGRDRGLTGRDEIWANGVHFIDRELLLGYGYYGFFDTGTFSPVWQLWDKFENFLTPHFHNSGMDITISLGIIGLGLYIMVLLRGFKLLNNDTLNAPVRLIFFLILLLFVMTSAFDFTLMKHNHFSTFFMFYIFFLAQKTSHSPSL